MSATDDNPTPLPDEKLSRPEVARRWLDVIKRYDRAFETWSARVRKILKIYTDERGDEDASTILSNKRKFNIYWANIQTLQPAIYAKMPNPSVSRRYKDDDRTARVASEMLERALSYNNDRCGFDTVMRHVRDDYLHAARGQVWIRYEPEVVETPDGPQLVDEYVCADFVPWSDFGHNVARVWDEVTCVWRKAYMTRAELKKRFGDKVGAAVGLDHKADEDDKGQDDPNVTVESKATVYEIWDKTTSKVYFIAKKYENGPLEVSDPFLDFEDFFPCPRPVYGTLKGLSLIPVPDYVLYQDQLEEIDELTVRMGKLLDALKLVGFYPSSSDEASMAIEKALKPGVENQMIPIPTWGEFKEGGGASSKIEWLPIDQVAKVLQACNEARKQLIEDVYQITGISDIVRGESDASETATAQQIKSQWGSIRIRDRQAELARFARDVCRLIAEVISDKFQPETLMSMTNMQLPTDQEVQAMMQAQAMQMAAAPASSTGAAPGGPPGLPPGPGGPPQLPPPQAQQPQGMPQ